MNELPELLHELVAINSINPTLAAGPGEAELARWCAKWLGGVGLEPTLQEVAPGRLNVIARVPGRGEAPPLLLNAHLDTVGVEGMRAPFVLRQEGDRLHGRGSYDMKGSIAIMLALAARFGSRSSVTSPAGDLWLTLVSDEEDVSLGTEALLDAWLPSLDLRPAAAIVLEPTEEGIGIAHKGFVWFEIETQGRAAHGSRPDEGIDAIVPLGAALAELSALEAELAAMPGDPLLGQPSLHASTVSGGTAWSVYPATALLRWERRTLPSEDETRRTNELERVVAAVRRAGRVAVSGREVFSRAPLGSPADSPIVRAIQAASPAAELVGLSFWTDGALFAAAGIPTVIYGPTGHGAHADDEWVSASSLDRVFATLAGIIEAGAWGR